MLQFAFARSFEQSLKAFVPHEKISIQRQMDHFILALEVRRIPSGFGLKKLGGDLWETRMDLAIRVLFEWQKNAVTFLFVGNHNEIHKFLKHYL